MCVCVCAFLQVDIELKALTSHEKFTFSNYPDFRKQEKSKSTTFHLIKFMKTVMVESIIVKN